MAAPVTDLPEGFTVDESLPEGFTVDAPAPARPEPRNGQERAVQAGLIEDPRVAQQRAAAAKTQQKPGMLDFLMGAPRQGHEENGIVTGLRQGIGAIETLVGGGSAATTGFAGGLMDALDNIVKRAGYSATGQDTSKLPGLDEAFSQGADRYTYSPRTPVGQAGVEALNSPEAQAVMNSLGAHVPAAHGARDTQALANVREAVSPAMGERISTARVEAPELAGVKAAAEAGYKLTPNAAKGGKVSRVVQTAAGSARLQKELSAHNAENTARLAREDLGLPADEPLTPEVTAGIRKEAGQDYQVVKDVGKFKNDEQYTTDLDKIVKPLQEAAADFPDLANNPIIKKVEGLRNEEVSTSSAVEVVKDLRNESQKAFRAGDKNLGMAYRSAALAVDNSMNRALSKMVEEGGDPALADAVSKYQDARVRIAKSYLADDAMNGKPGEIDAKVYGRALKEGVPLTGAAKQIGEFAKQFGEEGLAQKKGKSGDIGATYMDLLMGAMHTGGSALLSLGARPLARAALGSDFVQRQITSRARNAPELPGRVAAEPAAFEPGLAQGFETAPAAEAPKGPLGDLTPNWETAPGAAPEGQPAVSAEGLVPALGDEPVTTGNPKAKLQIPAAPGRPDLPDVMVAGRPSEVAPDAATGRAMQSDNAALARRTQQTDQNVAAAQQERAQPVPSGEATEITPTDVQPAKAPVEDPRLLEIDRLRLESPSEAVRRVLDSEAAKIQKDIDARAKQAKLDADATELRQLADKTTDTSLQAALRASADKLSPSKEKPSAPAQVTKQSSVQQERVGGDEGGQTAKASAGDSVQREAKVEAEKGTPPKEVGGEHLDFGLPKIDESFLAEQQRQQAIERPQPSAKGIRQVREALKKGIEDGTIHKDGGELALWALDKNPNLARNLRVEAAGEHPVYKGAKGAYNDAKQIVTLFDSKGKEPTTAAHEILHHSERLMPPAVQAGIRKAWRKDFDAAARGASKDQRAAFGDALKALGGDLEAKNRVMEALSDGTLNPKEHYHLINPSEYWAVNAAKLLNERFVGRGSWRAEAKRWLQEMVEHVKGTVGLRSDSAVLKALDEVMNPQKVTGATQSPEMLRQAEALSKAEPKGGKT